MVADLDVFAKTPLSTRPSHFFDLDAFDWLPALTRSFTEIRKEAQAAMERYQYLRFRYPDLMHSANRGTQGHRATFYLDIYGMELKRNRSFCPHAAEALSQVPGLVTSAIYLLDARSRILPHTGVTNSVLRGHMGLICPPGCFLRVGSETREWTEAGFLVFDDTVDHEAWNESDECRAILLFDFFPDDPKGQAREDRLRALRAGFLGPKDYPWLLAADVAADEETMAQMRAAPPVGPYRERDLRPLVETSGLFFP